MLFFGLALLIGGVAVLYRYRVEIVDLLLRPVIPAWSRRLLGRVGAWARPVAARLAPHLEPLRPWRERLRRFPRVRRPPRLPARQHGGAPVPRVPAPGRVRRPLVGGRGVTTGRRAAGRGSSRRVYTPPRPDPGVDGTLVRWVPGRAAVPPGPRHLRDED